MTPLEVRTVIIQGLEKALGLSNDPRFARRITDPAADIRFDEVELDSLYATELSLTIEDETGYVCDLGDFLCYPSVDALAAFIAEQTGGEPGGKRDHPDAPAVSGDAKSP